jgi:hypothetical protein
MKYKSFHKYLRKKNMSFYRICHDSIYKHEAINRGIETSWSPVQGVLPTVLGLVTEIKRKFHGGGQGRNLGVDPQKKKIYMYDYWCLQVQVWFGTYIYIYIYIQEEILSSEVLTALNMKINLMIQTKFSLKMEAESFPENPWRYTRLKDVTILSEDRSSASFLSIGKI